MIYTTNFNNSQDDMARYKDKEDIRRFCRENHLDGLEYMRIPQFPEDQIPMDLIQGIHLSSYQNWMDLWLGNEKALLEEFGSLENVEKFYGGTTREVLVDKFRQELDKAQELGVKYVVFHISEVNTMEPFTYQFHYTDHEVVTSAAELINEILDGRNYTFDFLMENLWWPGMNLLNPEVTAEMMEKVNYPRKGIMLDTGHLLHTNPELKTQEEGVAYIHKILDHHGQLSGYIKGVHLQQSLTGDITRDMCRKMKNHEIHLKEDYWERFGQVFTYIFQLDKHEPFTGKGIGGLLERINPEYVTFEYITRTREEHESYLRSEWDSLINQE